ncbi:MAG: DoxX family protein [Acidobacteriota bacterium]
MANLNSLTSTWTPRLLSILRIVAAFLFLAHGSQKLFGFPPPAQSRPGGLTPLILVGGVLEFFGGLLLMLGVFTRPVAFILSGMMAVAYFMAHAPQGFWPVLNGGELAALYSFVFLYLAAAGGGAWSVENLWRNKQ